MGQGRQRSAAWRERTHRGKAVIAAAPRLTFESRLDDLAFGACFQIPAAQSPGVPASQHRAVALRETDRDRIAEVAGRMVPLSNQVARSKPPESDLPVGPARPGQ